MGRYSSEVGRKPTNPAGVPCWSHNRLICTGEVYQNKLNLTFAHGATLPDPTHLFDPSLIASTRRAIDVREGDEIDNSTFKALVRPALEGK